MRRASPPDAGGSRAGDVAGLARGGASKPEPAKGDARALSVRRDDVLAGQHAGRQCEEQRPEPSHARVLTDAGLMVECFKSAWTTRLTHLCQ